MTLYYVLCCSIVLYNVRSCDTIYIYTNVYRKLIIFTLAYYCLESNWQCYSYIDGIYKYIYMYIIAQEKEKNE